MFKVSPTQLWQTEILGVKKNNHYFFFFNLVNK